MSAAGQQDKEGQSPVKAADADLARMLADADGAGFAPGEAPPPPLDPEQQKEAAIAQAATEFRGYLDALVEAATSMEIPKVAELLPEKRRDKIARAAGAVAIKRGWTLGDMFARWREEIELVEALSPILIFAGLQVWERLKARNAPALPKPAPAPAAATPAPIAPAGTKKPTFEVNGEPVS